MRQDIFGWNLRLTVWTTHQISLPCNVTGAAENVGYAYSSGTDVGIFILF